MPTTAITKINLDGVPNARGFGQPLPWLVRTASLDTATPADVKRLEDLGVTLVIDLREPNEKSGTGTRLPTVSIPLYRQGPPRTEQIDNVYDMLLHGSGDAIAQVIQAIAHNAGGTLVHCAAGKDRTGLVVALSLLATGTDQDTVIADYASSAANFEPAYHHEARENLRALGLSHTELEQAWELQTQSPRHAIEHALTVIAKAGGASAYLRSQGVSDETLSLLQDKAGATH